MFVLIVQSETKVNWLRVVWCCTLSEPCAMDALQEMMKDHLEIVDLCQCYFFLKKSVEEYWLNYVTLLNTPILNNKNNT